MRSRILVALVMLYVGVDFSTPMLPGAFSFDPDDSVDGSYAGQTRQDVTEQSPRDAASTARALDPRPVGVVAAKSPRLVRVAGPPTHVSRSHLDGRATPAPDDDH